MNIREIRRQRVLQLITERFHGVDAQFADAIDRSPTQVARWFMETKNRRPIGEKIARDIEKQLNLARGWLDTEPGAEAPGVQQPLGVYAIKTEVQAELLDLFDHLSDEQQEELLAELNAKKLSNEAVFKRWNTRLKHVSRQRAAEHLPPAPKAKIKA